MDASRQLQCTPKTAVALVYSHLAARGKLVMFLQVYTHFAEALDGLATIRAFDKQPRFAATNEALVAATQRASIAGVATAQWLALRLQLMTAVIVFLIALLAVLDAEDVLPSARPGRPINVGASLSAAMATACMSACGLNVQRSTICSYTAAGSASERCCCPRFATLSLLLRPRARFSLLRVCWLHLSRTMFVRRDDRAEPHLRAADCVDPQRPPDELGGDGARACGRGEDAPLHGSCASGGEGRTPPAVVSAPCDGAQPEGIAAVVVCDVPPVEPQDDGGPEQGKEGAESQDPRRGDATPWPDRFDSLAVVTIIAAVYSVSYAFLSPLVLPVAGAR